MPERITAPYISVRSASTQQTFRLYLQRLTADAQQDGTFSAYGLSSQTGPTVPLF